MSIVEESDFVRIMLLPTRAPEVTPPPIVTSKLELSALVNVIVLLVDSKEALEVLVFTVADVFATPVSARSKVLASPLVNVRVLFATV